MNDPVLDRAMFRAPAAPVSAYGTGIASNVASPEENARALQMAFQPTGYAGGGQVINGVKHFKKGGENDISPSTDVGDVLNDYVDTPSESSGLPPNFKFSESSASFKSPEVQALYDATLAETGNPNAAMARVLRAYPNEMMMASPPPVPGPRGGGFRPAAPRFTPAQAPGPLPPRFVPKTLASQPAGGPPPVIASPATGGARYPSPPAAQSQLGGNNAGKTMAAVLAPAAVAGAAGIPSLSELQGMAERSRDRLDNPPEAAPEAPAVVQRPSRPLTGLFGPTQALTEDQKIGISSLRMYDQDTRDEVRNPYAAGSPAADAYFRRQAASAPSAADVKKSVWQNALGTPEGKAALDMMDEASKRKSPALYRQAQETLDKLEERAYQEAGIMTDAEKANIAKEAQAQASSGLYGRPDAAPAVQQASTEAAKVQAAAATAEAAKASDEQKRQGGGTTEESALGKRLSLRIDELKQEREANKAQQKENQLLALMQAGFGMMAGKSSNALTNIGAGGAAGIATLSELEKTRRAEDAALRNESLQLELSKEKMVESAAERQSQRELLAHNKSIQDTQNQAVNLRQAHDSLGSRIVSLDAKLTSMAGDPTGTAIVKAEMDKLTKQYDTLNTELMNMFRKQGAISPSTDFKATVLGSRPTQPGT